MSNTHVAEAQPRPSIFYHYKVYPVEPLPSQAAGDFKQEVLIVGAGPIGLATALDLARFGVASRIIEAERQVSHGSRAIVLTRRSMEILQMLGCDQAFVEKGLSWQMGRSYYRGQEVYQMQMPHSKDERFGPGTNIQQQYIEQFLVEAAEENPLIHIHWGHKVTGIEQNEHCATLDISSEDGSRKYSAPWVVAADGGRSTIRKLLKLRMEGEAYTGNFVIADIKADIDLPTERLCHFDPPWSPGNNVLVHREPEGIWRLDFRLPDGESPEQAMEEKQLADRINKILTMIGQEVPWQLDWATVYSASTKTLTDYQEQRVLFVGDAAHLLPIFGVRGANTGLQDANNLAWKLAMHMQGKAGPKLLRSYSTERVQAAREICKEAGKSTRFMSPPTRGARLLRDAVLSLSLTESFVRDLLHWRTSRPHSYYNSPLNSTATSEYALLGEVTPNVKLGDNQYLHDYTLKGFTVLIFLKDENNSAELKKVIERNERDGMSINPILITRTHSGDQNPSHCLTIDDKEGKLFERYDLQENSLLLIRPDQHICGLWQSGQNKESPQQWIHNALRNALCLTPSGDSHVE
ncbi:FAD-dependent monooxygenase [Pseudoteredinibacter isoporae]|uniref:3-(3-hydroxy-phenyl)propionate hydroxylase n=1 Tax=Pseudoteredinibacter isoporae TaxID=570281 RepID=A0A7X0MXD8_9GAMM|nr:FAD-dependent monooxygenase [Pseudoteredinibacter isoporae]MBB6523383.1 3-(3-hydroxy-phenyl)propionate hydroxylase [Pseudoteredinibacter isoporae]NHO88895.1 monooxygenase [Pseudoteredinibacter isoporae]NIB24397.1 monooxygenase [Pseudoteredinibacter isoporae]